MNDQNRIPTATYSDLSKLEIIEQGHLYQCPHGRQLITGWHWNTSGLYGAIPADTLAEYLSERHEIEHVHYLDHCADCNPEGDQP